MGLTKSLPSQELQGTNESSYVCLDLQAGSDAPSFETQAISAADCELARWSR